MASDMNAEFWKRKLAAYLHDPPSKCLDIRTHGERSDAAFRQAGFTDTEIGDYFKHADHTGAAADRFPFPSSASAGLSCAFDGVRNAFRHPLSGEPVPFHAEFRSVEEGFEGENSVQPALSFIPEDWPDDKMWRARFFAHWRCWPRFAIEKDYRFAFLPADTRLPDHTIWTHMQVVSALAGCVDEDNVWRPAFLKFQLGPVQEFIAQARSTRDLWSGSYLLSWLMAAGLKKFSELAGPDAVIYPSLCGQPLFDLHWRKDLWSKIRIGDRPVWESIEPLDKERDLLTPNLPNVFLALVSAQRSDTIAREVEKAIRDEFKRIAQSVWDACEQAGLTNNPEDHAFAGVNRKARFDRQIDRFLSIAWQITPWPETPEQAIELAKQLPFAPDEDGKNGKTLLQRVETVIEAAQEKMPQDHRDRRYYTDDQKTRLNNIGVAWALLTALNSWQLDAVRQTRHFNAWNDGGWRVGAASNKDSLTGKEEAVAGGRVWLARCKQLAGRAEGAAWNPEHGPLANRFKHDDWLGAITLVKRLWDLTYLKPNFGLDPLRMPNTHGLARHAPFSNADDEPDVEGQAGDRYFAVLAFDGDQIGKWVAGDKCPPFSKQLAGYTDSSGNPAGALEYFQRESDPDGHGTLRSRYAELLNTRRPVSPSYHLQFSEALTNFALLCARPIVEIYDGRLIYSGGDDVVALLPADTALECARALQLAFTGDARLPEMLRQAASRLLKANEKAGREPSYYQKLAASTGLFRHIAPGCLAREDIVDQQDQPIPFLVPGPDASASVGIAIAHFSHPLQDAVREAQAAEKRAKKDPAKGGLGRSAVAVTLLKRSGETIHWGCQWDSRGLDACQRMIEALHQDVLSAKFPHRVIELIDGYQAETTDKPEAIRSAANFAEVVDAILSREVAVAADRQRGTRYSREAVAEIQEAIGKYLQALPSAEAKVQALIGLCQTAAFIARNLSDRKDAHTGSQSRASRLESEIPQPADRQPTP